MGSPALALGTVQFGVAYGVAGGARVSEADARLILRRAWELGIRRLDTAPAYGSIEDRLSALSGDLPFSIVTKIQKVPSFDDRGEAQAYVRASIRRSRQRLGERLSGILFHSAEDLAGADGRLLWNAAEAESEGRALGWSCYDPETSAKLQGRFPGLMAQLPGSALDQGLVRVPPSSPIEISLRSIFLQGLLLMPLEEAASRVPAARGALEHWHRFCSELQCSPLQAALSVAKSFDQAQYLLVGVDSLAQLEQIAEAWEGSIPIEAPLLDTPDQQVIDPRRWIND